MNRIIKSLLQCIIILSLCCTVHAETIKIASYNVENLFDLVRDGTEYSEYIPGNPYGWNKQSFNIKINNIAKVIKDLNPDIIGLQEIESDKVLIALQRKLKDLDVLYPYRVISVSKTTSVRCALLSRFPIIRKEEINVRNKSARSILKATVEINDVPLIIFVNHWKSKQGPESLRVAYAKALKKELDKLEETTDFIILGDLNSNYNEYKTFLSSSKLNNTSGITGINHILKTIKNQNLVTETDLIGKNNSGYLYNLWLELELTQRWSYTFFEEKSTPDSIILSPGLYDNKGISYVDNSFNKFSPDYLFKNGRIYRWERSEKGRGKHLGLGYSDHLPIFAYFSTEPFQAKNGIIFNDASNDLNTASKKDLVDVNTAALSELITIPGIGRVLAQRIKHKRPYAEINGLLKVKGIGKKKLEQLTEYIIIK